MKSTNGPTSWLRHFEDSGITDEIQSSYMAYVERMYATCVPPIFEFRHLAQLLGRTKGYLASVINCPAAHYRQFQIPKRRGGMRTITAPYPALLECQRWLNANILAHVKAHHAAHGFAPRRSILSNARPHLASKHVLKLDLRDFFPSIRERRIIAVFKNFGYPPNVAFYLARICCVNRSLPQGGATSPALSNIVARKLDARLGGLCRKFRLAYSRYADDLTFSGERISVKTIEIVRAIIKDEGFEVNDSKTRLSRSRGRRIVTGISVSGDEPRIPRELRRRLRQEAHYISTYGFASHAAKCRIRDPIYLESLYGKLLFWHWVEPTNAYAQKAISLIAEYRQRAI